MPVSSELLNDEWVAKYRVGDARVNTEILMALAEKSERFTPRDIPTLSELMDKHSGTAPIQPTSTLVIEQGEVEKATAELHLQQLTYDFQVWRVYDSKMKSYTGAVQLHKMNWRLKAHEENKAAVDHFLKKQLQHHPQPQARYSTTKDQGGVSNDFNCSCVMLFPFACCLQAREPTHLFSQFMSKPRLTIPMALRKGRDAVPWSSYWQRSITFRSRSWREYIGLQMKLKAKVQGARRSYVCSYNNRLRL